MRQIEHAPPARCDRDGNCFELLGPVVEVGRNTSTRAIEVVLLRFGDFQAQIPKTKTRDMANEVCQIGTGLIRPRQRLKERQ